LELETGVELGEHLSIKTRITELEAVSKEGRTSTGEFEKLVSATKGAILGVLKYVIE
jgi:hypothetical protein